MAEAKTQRTKRSVDAFLKSIPDEQKRQDAFALVDIMRKATKAEPVMWGSSIVGFGTYRYKYASGRTGEWPLTGFSPRKQNLTLYIMSGFEQYDELLKSLGKFKTGKACLYVNRLDDVDLPTLRKLIKQSVQHMIKTNPV
ncbi:MAG: DUF1801 domain-containing protein [Chloroflexi bacterium]|jgi:hypothetical protein|nr:DUF1801 domain-containing protein [Chloroflexota bacterium]